MLSSTRDQSATPVIFPVRVATGSPHSENLALVKKQLLVLESRLFQVWFYTARTAAEVLIHGLL